MSWLSRGLFLACAVCLGAAVFGAYRNPGLVTRITQKGVDYAADTVAWQLTNLAKGGVPLGSRSVSESGYFSREQLSLSNMAIAGPEGLRLGAKVDEDIGLKVSLRITEIQIRGNLYYRYTLLRIPIVTYRYAFNVTFSNISLNFTAILEIVGAQAAAKATDCHASVSRVRFHFDPDDDGLARRLNIFEDSIVEWLFPKVVCMEIGKTQSVLIDDTNRYLRMCIEGTCTPVLVLPFVAQPVYGKGYVEMAHAVEILGQSETGVLSPFVPQPLRRIPEYRRMLAVYLSPYVANSLLYALYRSGRLAFKLTDKDLLVKLQDTDDSTKGGFCLARSLAQQLANSRLEVSFSATSCSRVELSDNITTLTIQSELTIKMTRGNSRTSTLERFHTNAFITGRTYIDNNRLSFNVTDDVAKQTGRQDFTSVGGGIGQILVKIVERKLFSKFSELGKVGIPLPEYANVRWENPSLISVDDAYVMTTDVAYSPNP